MWLADGDSPIMGYIVTCVKMLRLIAYSNRHSRGSNDS